MRTLSYDHARAKKGNEHEQKVRMKLALNRVEAELVLLVDASHRSGTEFTSASDDPAAVARKGDGDVDEGNGKLQLDVKDEELALSSLLQDGDFLLLDNGGDGGWQRASHGENR